MTATLDGYALPAVVDGAPTNIRWDHVYGTQPYELDVIVPVELGELLLRQRKPLGSTLVIESDEPKDKKEVRKLTIRRPLPAHSPEYIGLRIADLRWQWEYRWFRRSYNVRMKGGTVARYGDDPAALQVREPRIVYHPWSLKAGREAYTARSTIEDVLDAIAPGWADEDNVLSRDLAPVEDLDVNANHADALSQVLAYFGNLLSVYVDDQGQVKLKLRSRALAAGRGTRVRYTPPKVVPGPAIIRQDRSLERPVRVRVLFEPLVELRIDRVENDTAASGSTTRRAEPPRADDIVELPEDAEIGGARVARGGYSTLDDFLAYLAGREPSGLPELTRDILRRHWFTGALDAYIQEDAQNGLWALRLPEIQAAYRRQFQLRKAWRDRIRLLQPRRVGVANFSSGTRAPPAVFLDYAEVPRLRNKNSKRFTDPPSNHWMLRNVYAAGDKGPGHIVGTPIGELRKAPAEVRIVDQDQKVFRIDMKTDPTARTLVPLHAVDPDTIPTHALDDELISLQQCFLAEDFEMSVIMTAVMGSPNDKRVFWAVEVTPHEVQSILPGASITPAQGPVLEVAVSGVRAPARFAWDDSVADQVYEAFDEQSNTPIQSVFPRGPVNQAQLQEVAKAVAAAVYLRLSDREVGGYRTGMDSTMRLDGYDARVSWGIDERGPYSERIVPEDGPLENFEAFLPPGVRRMLDFMVDPGGR